MKDASGGVELYGSAGTIPPAPDADAPPDAPTPAAVVAPPAAPPPAP
eukprot:CAMPEP_0178671804 /NCGR_PEP_ID=MMETSP0698-20121128/33382_1 /TAXON_ID=265572 /ORGANISM="Extubocellulus spinifer, Strain CCMP396" /LENGTH=46 /DNA_ID= /DNA_START= /DNA_END= /DNA_ORIENTATION=